MFKTIGVFLVVIFFASFFSACGTEGQTITVVNPDNEIVGTLEAGQGGVFMSLSGNVAIQGDVSCDFVQNGQSYATATVSFASDATAFVALLPAEYNLICTAFNTQGVQGNGYGWVKVEPKVVSPVTITLVFQRAQGSGVEVTVEQYTAPTFYFTVDAASPTGMAVSGDRVVMGIFNIQHDSDVAEPLSNLSFTVESQGGVDVADCWIEDLSGIVMSAPFYQGSYFDDWSGLDVVYYGYSLSVEIGVGQVQSVVFVCDMNALINAIARSSLFGFSGGQRFSFMGSANPVTPFQQF